DDRAEDEERAVSEPRDDVLLHRQLDAVGDRLEEAVRADFHRSEAALHVGRDLALGPHGPEREEVQEAEHDARDDEERARGRHGARDLEPDHLADEPLDVETALLAPGLPGGVVVREAGCGGLEEESAHRSTSPMTMSRLPITATMSASIESPRAVMASSTLMFEKDGARALTR